MPGPLRVFALDLSALIRYNESYSDWKRGVDMRDFLLRIYTYMKQLDEAYPLRAAAAVALGMLSGGDRLAICSELLPGGISPEEAACLPDYASSPAIAVGAALAMRHQDDGSVVIAPVSHDAADSDLFPPLLHLASSMHLPVVFLMECDAEFPDDLEAHAALGDIERIEADASDAMRLMPALRLGIDKAREGDGPTLIECIFYPSDDAAPSDPVARLADVLITEGYATPEELL